MRRRPMFSLHVVLLSMLALPVSSLGATQETEQEKQEEPRAPAPLPKGKKLVLKDGTFHIVRSYERKGDRVRYYSVERSSWEEIPAELVDWDATARAEADEARRREELAEKARASKVAELATNIDVDASIEVVPGVFLSDKPGLYVFDGKTLTMLVQVPTDVKLDKGMVFARIMVPVPVIPTRHLVEIKGKRAALRLAAGQLEFYIRTADERELNLELVKAKVKGNTRQVELVDTNVVGEKYAKRNSVSVQVGKLSKRVSRITLGQQLEPGEYVIAEILPDGMSFYVWEFGIDEAEKPNPPKSR